MFLQTLIKVLLIMVVLFSFILPGFLLKKVNFITTNSLTSLSNILLYVCQPILFIKAFAYEPLEPTKDILINMLWVFGFTFVGIVAVFFIARLCFFKMKDRSRADVYTFIASFSNCGFIGIPFVDMLTGGHSTALMYITIFNVAFSILMWTLGVYLMTQNIKDINLKRAFLNPAIIGCMIGFILFLFPQINIFNMPQVADLQNILLYISPMTSVISMLIVGARMAELPLKSIFNQPTAYIACALRLIIAPLVMFLIVLPFKLNGFFADDMYVWCAPVIAMCISPAASIVAYAEKFNGNRSAATTTFLLGTLLSIITMPIIVTLITV